MARSRSATRAPASRRERSSAPSSRFHLRGQAGHNSPDGAGLGLAIVRELTEAMGGSVAVENLFTQGARFTVRLPATS
ncbi:MAG: ATP-binding protein [Solirubrobacterales bacterium]